MNKNFWEGMVKAWCRGIESIDIKTIETIAEQHASKDKVKISGYGVNPLDDDDDDEEDDW